MCRAGDYSIPNIDFYLDTILNFAGDADHDSKNERSRFSDVGANVEEETKQGVITSDISPQQLGNHLGSLESVYKDRHEMNVASQKIEAQWRYPSGTICMLLLSTQDEAF